MEPAAKRRLGHYDERKQQKKQIKVQKRKVVEDVLAGQRELLEQQQDDAVVPQQQQQQQRPSAKQQQQEQEQPPAKRQRVREKATSVSSSAAAGAAAAASTTPAPAPPVSRMDKYRKKIDGAKFRMINESLYNGEALSSQDFKEYHHGFASQVELWPTNPCEVICSKLEKRKRCVIGDFGCGNARLQQALKGKHKVHSFDLVASHPSVIECDISKHVPLEDETLDVAVFSLSLMGQDVTSFFVEANRVLKLGGEVIVAEVKSRFVDKVKSEESEDSSLSGMKRGIRAFQRHLLQLGFSAVECDEKTNSMFVLMRFKKSEHVDGAKASKIKMPLNNCPYKRR